MPPFRAKQVLEWVYQRGVVDPELMTNLSKRDREQLAAGWRFLSGHVVSHKSATDGVEKLLVQWDEAPAEAKSAEGGSAGLALPVMSSAADSSKQTECVMIPAVEGSEDDDRRTACISSQVGCPVGCRFCASGLGGLDGNLSSGRIVEQVWRLRDVLRTKEGTPTDPFPRITNVVFMGMGEPLANFGNVTAAIRAINALWGMGISARKITVSTVGLPAAIERLAEQFDLPITLALSLHAPTDEIRRELIPWAQYSTIKDLLAACQKWFQKTGREITLEYTLLRGVNDRPEHAEELARLAKSLRANVNLIRYNEVAGLPFERPVTEDVRAFQMVLRDRKVNAHIRASRGRDIAAACGQLRHEQAGAAGGGA
jgi:23S rRNA (adenine2503-C2)-methyltransferase